MLSNHLIQSGTYRYRSYRYDTETGLYYLNSRYYNPEWGRFLNGDNYGGQVGEILTHNIYTYCLNNPINNVDYDGEFAIPLVPAIPGIIKGLVDIGLAVFGFTVGTAIGEKVYDKVTDRANEKAEAIPRTPPKLPQYWKAYEDATPAIQINYMEAQKEVRQGRNIICINQYAAFQVAKSFPEMIGPEVDRDKNGKPILGHYYHYHISKKHGVPHIWFYGVPPNTK